MSDRIAAIMADCIERGLSHRGILPGRPEGSAVAPPRSTPGSSPAASPTPALPHEAMDYVSVFAMAVNEENAAGGRIVTRADQRRVRRDPGDPALLQGVLRRPTRTASASSCSRPSAVGDLIKRNASISGAEVGCQGEVGSAAAMAAAGLCAALGGTPQQVLNAAEIGLGASSRHDLRPDRRPRADSLHRAQRVRRGQGHQRRVARFARRRLAFRELRPGDRDDAPDRPRHEIGLSRDVARRPRGQRPRVLRRRNKGV